MGVRRVDVDYSRVTAQHAGEKASGEPSHRCAVELLQTCCISITCPSAAHILLQPTGRSRSTTTDVQAVKNVCTGEKTLTCNTCLETPPKNPCPQFQQHPSATMRAFMAWQKNNAVFVQRTRVKTQLRTRRHAFTRESGGKSTPADCLEEVLGETGATDVLQSNTNTDQS